MSAEAATHCVWCKEPFIKTHWRTIYCSSKCVIARHQHKIKTDAVYREHHLNRRKREHSIPKNLAVRRAYAHRTGQLFRAYLAAEKLAHGCAKCGYNEHPAALDFDHIRGVKLYDVSKTNTIEKATIEIAKCQVLCANCHRIETYERKQTTVYTHEGPPV